jgi:hypothetical protein
VLLDRDRVFAVSHSIRSGAFGERRERFRFHIDTVLESANEG